MKIIIILALLFPHFSLAQESRYQKLRKSLPNIEKSCATQIKKIKKEGVTAKNLSKVLKSIQELPTQSPELDDLAEEFKNIPLKNGDLSDYVDSVQKSSCPPFEMFELLSIISKIIKPESKESSRIIEIVKKNYLHQNKVIYMLEISISLALIKKFSLAKSKENNQKAFEIHDELKRKLKIPYPKGFWVDDFEEVDKTGDVKKSNFYRQAILDEYKAAKTYRDQILKLLP